MDKCIMTGCDLHDKSMLLKSACDREDAVKRSFGNDGESVEKMVAYLEKTASEKGAKRIVFAYEASHLGFGLYDRLTEAGIECYVLAPTRLPRTPKSDKVKTDERDAE